MALQRRDIAAGSLSHALDDTLEQLRRDRIVERILERDHTVWKSDPAEISNRLGWLDSPATLTAQLAGIDDFVSDVRAAGFTHALLLGMGGSSLAPEVFRRIFGVGDGSLDLRVLDSTDPSAVQAAFDASPVSTTLYLPATKSGGTVETLSFLKYGFRHASRELNSDPGQCFVAITDPGSGLADLARQLGFRHTFLNDPDIGGRYSALSLFGIVPAALCGVDVRSLLAAGQSAIDELTQLGVAAPGVLLGALLGTAALQGRDKLTLLSSARMAPFGVWIEQLVAESTGKETTGILPVDGEPVGDVSHYGDDRLFVDTRHQDDAADDTMDRLSAAGHPTTRITLDTPTDLGAEMVRWELATIIAGHLLQINPFDQPDVESAKIQARSMVSAYQDTGQLPSTDVLFRETDIEVSGDVRADNLTDLWRQVVASSSVSYIALQAYLPVTTQTDATMLQIRRQLRDATGKATTTGYGPRFLHSTGQLHKGDAGRGLFIQLTCDDITDADIPDTPDADVSRMSFGVLKAAQALGDAGALRQGGRQVVRFHLGGSIDTGLLALSHTLDGAID